MKVWCTNVTPWQRTLSWGYTRVWVIYNKLGQWPIDLFKLSLSDNIRSVQIQIYHKLCAVPYPLSGSNNHKLWRTSLKSLRILSCDPMCKIWKISSLFGTLNHKQSIITPVGISRWCVSVTFARWVSLIGHFGHFKSKLNFFCWILSRCSA